MKLRSAGRQLCTFKFTGVTEIRCWTLYGEGPGSLRNKDFNDKLRNNIPTPRTQAAAEVAAWMIFSLTFLVGDCSASWAIRVEVEMAEEEEKT